MAAPSRPVAAKDFAAEDFVSRAPERFCDIIMKGGVTSGIVYPRAVCHLAQHFVIKSIGGTSVGAIAAAVTAAAEYRRRTAFAGAPNAVAGAGYVALSKLPDYLSRDRVLLKLFAADFRARPLLRIALGFVGTDHWLLKTLKVLGLTFRGFWPVTLAFIIASSFFVRYVGSQTQSASLIAMGVILAALVVVAATLGAAAFWCVRILATNDFGWCHAHDPKRAARYRDAVAQLPDGDLTALTARDTPPLFQWLHSFIEYAAGPGRSTPLTFGDLARAPMPPWDEESNADQSIDFRMVTTCATLGRPFELPFDPKILQAAGVSFYFRPDDLEHYFPAQIVAHMVATSPAVVTGQDNATYHAFPAADDLPIAVATRMSMSFPVLFCPLRLFAKDSNGDMQPVWFTDGGLTSNFPIFFFDSPLPRWPTFAIDLLGGGTLPSSRHDPIPAGNVFMEDVPPAAALMPWDKIGTKGLIGPIADFASAIVDAMRTWQDSTLSSLPGNRSRTVGIRLPGNEGGINLNMQKSQIDDLIERGDLAGSTLLDRFVDATPDPAGWQDHRWTRYRATMGSITRWWQGFNRSSAWSKCPPNATYADLIKTRFMGPPADKAACIDAFEDLSGFFEARAPRAPRGHAGAMGPIQNGEPLPKGDLVLHLPI
jgi:predicted acylesterase/phospholipase RssA